MTNKHEQLLQEYELGKLSRRSFITALSALTTLSSSNVSSNEKPTAEITSINHVTFFVKDIPATAAFYQRLFGLKVLSNQGTGINLATGTTGQFLGFFGGSAETDPTIHHVCLGVKNFDLATVLDVLKAEGLEAQVRMREERIPEVYFIDPNGIRVQLQDESYCGGSGILGNQCKA